MPSRPSSIPMLSEAQFDRLRQLVEQEAGLTISSPKKKELHDRIIKLIEQQNISTDASIDRFIRDLNASPTMLQNIINDLTIGESYFFRNHPHFNALKNEIIPALIEKNAERRRLKIWSAGSSTGEEPYSLAIMLQRDFPMLSDWDVKIMATDINTESIIRAQKARYTKWSFRGVDQRTIDTYFNEQKDGGFYLDDSIKNKVTFSRLNLAAIPNKTDAFVMHCDLIMCRNVLIYFKEQLATEICETFSNCLDPYGYLMLGHSESFPALANLKTVYSHATYYYRKRSNTAPRSHPPKSRMSFMPGLASYNPEKMFMPWDAHQESAAAPNTLGSKRISPRQSFDALDTELKNAIEEDLKTARNYSMTGDLREAEELLDKLESTDGKLDFRVYFLKALISDQSNSPEDALANLKQAIFLNKDFTIGHYYQGIIAERFGDIPLAKRGYRNAHTLAEKLRPDAEVSEGGGIRAQILCDIASERLKELELQDEQ